jgi:hypothetical protein
MAKGQPGGNKARGYMGRALVVLGLAVLLADAAFLAPSFEQLIEGFRQGLLGLVPALGLSLLHAVRVIVLQQVDYVSLVSRILVLFSSLALMVTGAVLWGRRSSENAAPDHQIYRVSFGGDR